MPGENHDYQNVNVAELAASVGNDLFSPSGGSLEAPPAPAPAPIAAPAPAPVPAPAPAPWEALPAAWKKDMETHWTGLPPEVRQYVHNREQQVLSGINGYAKNAKAWEELISPFQPVLQQAPNLNPVPILQGLMQSHLALSNPNLPATQKAQLLREVAKAYKVELAETASAAASQGVDITRHPEFVAMSQRLQQLEGGWQAQRQQEYNARLADTSKNVEAFFADPKNTFAEEVANDILHFIQTGAAADLQAAYDMAIWSNPTVRAKLLAKQAEEAAAAAKPPVTNVEGTGTAGKRGAKTKTIDDTIDEVIAKHANPK